MQDIYEEVRRKAGEYFSEGYNCAQAVALSNLEVLNEPVEGVRRMAAGFGHGMSAGCACGALSGGVMAIGLLLAGPEISGFDQKITEAVAELHQRFIAEFGLTCCRGLRKKSSPFKNGQCLKITVTAAAITLELLLSRKQLPLAPVRVHPL